MSGWQVGETTITRVAEDGFDLVLAQDDETTRLLRSQSSWLAPHFLTPEGALRIGSSAIVLQARGTLIVVDPWLAFDGPDRFAPEGAARVEHLLGGLARAGFAPEEVDVVVNTHIDGVGANTRPVDGLELVAFPEASYLLAAEELAALKAGRRRGAEAFETLVDEGRLELVRPDHRITDAVRLEAAPGHSDGHLAVAVDHGDQHAVIAGHLFLHPAQVFAPGPRADLDENPQQAAMTRRLLLERCAAQNALLIGPLFAEPGGGRVLNHNDSWRLEPAFS